VRSLRLASGLSQEAFADKSGFVRSYMSRIERGKANPSLDAVETLADALGVTVAELFSEDVCPPTPPTGIQVPFAEDGSYFSRSTFRPRTKGYNVGGKGRGNVVLFKDFDAALDYLKSMPVAKWWRPNANGNWGLVTAVKWGDLPVEP